jgi:phage terminase large subunit
MAETEIQLELGALYPKQWAFMRSKARYTAYGGARGGGKTHVLIRKAIRGALEYPGCKILILRRTYPELENTIIRPMVELVGGAVKGGRPAGEEVANYRATAKAMLFCNGSYIKFGHLQRPGTLGEYQGQEYDWIFMDEATHFTEGEFRTIGATLRGTRPIPRQFFLTCNPGGIGHQWVKRLFITRSYLPGERGEEYQFIPATVEDNLALMEGAPEYIRMLDQLPEGIRAAHRYGDWDAMAGQYFGEFRPESHVVEPMALPAEWVRYRAIDYGLDMLACLWIAVDKTGRAYVYREVQHPGLIVSQAAQLMVQLTPPGEQITCTIAPPDLWSTQKDTGRTMEELFAQNGVPLVRASSNRVQGWLALKEYLKIREDGRPGMLVWRACEGLIRNLPALCHSERNPSDCATEPHEITHICDALRYFAQFRTLRFEGEEREEEWPSYDQWMRGGEPRRSYLNFVE